MKYNLYIFTLSIIFPGVLFSQNVEFKASSFKDKKQELKTIVEKISAADELTEAGFEKLKVDEGHTLSFFQALKLYNEANDFNPENAELNFKIGRCLLQTPQKTESIEFLEKAVSLDSEVNYEVYFCLGKAYKFNYEFEKAQKNFKIFRSKLKGKDFDIYNNKVKKELLECKSAVELIDNPARVWIENVDVLNTEFDDYSASVSADESVMILNSRNEGTMGGAKNQNEDYFADVYISYYENGKWTFPKQIGNTLNTDKDDECVALSGDAQRLFMVKDN